MASEEPGKLRSPRPTKGSSIATAAGVKDGDQVQNVGVELVEAVFQGHTGGQGDHAVVGGFQPGALPHHPVAHPNRPRVNPQHAHQARLGSFDAVNTVVEPDYLGL